MYKIAFIKRLLPVVITLLAASFAHAQIDRFHRNLLQLGYDQPLSGHGPQGVYLYYYYSNPELYGHTNLAIRAAVAPMYFDAEIGFKQLISPTTDVGLGFYGGGYGDNYYEVRQGHYVKSESFWGHGGGAALSIYQLLNPGMLIPVNVVLRGGARYTIFDDTSDTANNFELPEDRLTPFTRAGIRIAGKEPILNPDLGLELSGWFQRDWRNHAGSYGFNDDRSTEPQSDRYWVYLNMSYTMTNIGHKVFFATTAGGSTHADRFSAWRLGGVLPLIAEFPLTIPGYYYQELTAERLLHFYGGYQIPLDPARRFQFRVEAATAWLDYLPGFEQPKSWQTGAGCGVQYTPRNQVCRIEVRYGYAFNALRDGHEGSSSVGLLLQYDLEQHFLRRRRDNR